MIKWEYMLVLQPKTPTVAEDDLNSLGMDGWELCGIDYGCFIFKRPIPKPPLQSMGPR